MGVTLAIIGTIGVGTQVAGQVMAANAQASADQQSAAIKNAQADEIMSREAINSGILQTQEGRSEDLYQAAFASTGRGGAGGLGGVVRMRSDFAITQANNLRDAQFKAQMLRAGAAIDTTLASDAQVAGYLGGAGTLLNGATNVYSIYKKNSTPAGLYSTDQGNPAPAATTVLGATS